MKDKCFLIAPKHDITVVYVHIPSVPKWHSMAKRFVETYEANPPGCGHNTIIVAQGQPIYQDMVGLFNRLGPWQSFAHDNSGWDIGAFQRVAEQRPSPLMVFLSGTTYFRRPGWLVRMRDVFNKFNGVGLFGACGNGGDLGKSCHPHIRTSSFWCQPIVLLGYPERINETGRRYPFEHGSKNFTLWANSVGLPTVVVDFSNHWNFGEWGRNPRGYHQSDQHDLLLGDRNTEPPDYPHP
jgi:hypothetical protein